MATRKYNLGKLKHNTVTGSCEATEPDWNGGAGPGCCAYWFSGIGIILRGGQAQDELNRKLTLAQFQKLIDNA